MVGALHTVSLILTKTLQWRHYNHFTFYRWVNQSFGSLNDLPKVTILVTGRAKFESSSVSTQSPNENPHSSHTNTAKHTHYPWAFQSQNWIHRYYSEHCLFQVLTFLLLYTFIAKKKRVCQLVSLLHTGYDHLTLGKALDHSTRNVGPWS